jgi:23S rRNA (cytidine1920-2'-O)/16S rRNA (cytidine1409-2'-O)-methyltransferase
MDRGRRVKKIPLVDLLVQRRLVADERDARRWIMSGQVLVNDQPLDKPGMRVPADAGVRLRGERRYASRGGQKLEAALVYFRVDVSARVTLDCGASTGGFTDCLLRHGAGRVYAVEAGFGQLLGRLRADPRVHNLERTNLSDVSADRLDPLPTLISLDLSYLSLVQALPIAARLLASKGDILALFKPLFEVDSVEARRSGHIADSGLLVAALQRVIAAGRAAGLEPRGVAKLALPPRHGVHEYFLHFAAGSAGNEPSLTYDGVTLEEMIAGPGIGNTSEE